MNLSLRQSIQGIVRALCGLPSPRLDDALTTEDATRCTPVVVHRPISGATPSAAGFLRMEVDDRKKATGRFTLFSNGQVLTGTLEGNPESLGRFVEVRLQAHPNMGHKAIRNLRPPLPINRLRSEACDH